MLVCALAYYLKFINKDLVFVNGIGLTSKIGKKTKVQIFGFVLLSLLKLPNRFSNFLGVQMDIKIRNLSVAVKLLQNSKEYIFL